MVSRYAVYRRLFPRLARDRGDDTHVTVGSGVADSASTHLLPGSSPVDILSVFSDTEEFHAPKFTPVTLQPGQKLQLHVVLLPRRTLTVSGTLVIETSKGTIRVQVCVRARASVARGSGE